MKPWIHPISKPRACVAVMAASLWIANATMRAQAQVATPIVRTEVMPALAPYEELKVPFPGYFPRALYEEARSQTEFQALRIGYRSGELTVGGMLFRPVSPGHRKWPVIVFNRGGSGDCGRLSDLNRVDFYSWAKAGFVVVASDYRYLGSLRDQWGGDDVDDVMNLLPVIRSLDFVDASRLYIIGQSRGGTMTYLALKRGFPARAAVVIAGVSDLRELGRFRPEFIKGAPT